MTYAMTLDHSWEIMSEDEMHDVNGGMYVPDSTIQAIAFAIGVNAATTIPAAMTAIKIGAGIMAGWLAGLPGGNIIGVAGATYLMANVSSIAPAFVSAVVRRRGMDIGIDWWFALPVLSFSAR